MRRVNRRIMFCSIAVVAVVGLALAVAGSAFADDPPSAPGNFAVVVGSPIQGGTSSTVSVKVTDETVGGGVGLQAVDVFLPSASMLTVQSASVPAPATATITTCSDGGLTGACVQLRNLGLTNDGEGPATAIATLGVTTPPACVDVTAPWAAGGPDSDSDGDEPTVDPATSNLSSTIHDTCHLAFLAQPASALINQTISATAFTPTGPAVTVQILDLNGTVVTSSTAPITLSLNNNLSAATLAGATANAVSGVASFTNLAVNVGQDNYKLSAADSSDAGDFAPTTSTSFNIAQQGTACTGTCTLTPGTTGGTAKIVASTTGGGAGELAGSANILGESPLACTGTGYLPLNPNTYNFTTVSGTSAQFSKKVTITIVNPAGAPTPFQLLFYPFGPLGFLATQRICFQAPYTFTPLGGGAPVNTGLLPPCPLFKAPTGPCDSRLQDYLIPNGNPTPPHYNIVLTAVIPANALGDPRLH